MNSHTLQNLEFHSFIDFLAQHLCSESGRELLKGIKPSAKKKRAFQYTYLYQSFLKLRMEARELPSATFNNPHDIFKILQPSDSVLHSDEIKELYKLMECSAQIKSFLNSEGLGKIDALNSLRENIHSFRQIRDQIEEIFNEEFVVRDSASPELRMIRQEIIELKQTINVKLEQFLRHNNSLQEKIITQRNRRFVVPVRREDKSKVRGIIHDQSSSGQTLFVEPQFIVQLGNKLSTAISAEEKEIRRILKGLSNELREVIPEVKESFFKLQEYDLAYGVSLWASEYDCHFAKTTAYYRLRQARHPLLQRKFRDEGMDDAIVPLDLNLKDTDVLAITGSNTGGKTIALKTIGLLSLLFQSGFPLPVAPDSSLPFYENIFADIGDEQSIEQNLSTFSAHLKNIKQIIEGTESKNSLVLLDELGSGTDPVEGGALSCAILETLSEQKARTFATTHLGVIKVFVQEHPRMRNASVRFNKETLQPDYILQVGIPGASHALSIAQRLEVPKKVLKRAHAKLSDSDLSLEKVLAGLHDSKQQIEEDTKTTQQAREKAVREKNVLEKELKELREQRRSLLHKAQKEAEAIVRNTQKEMEKLLHEAKSQQEEKETEKKELRQKVQKKRQSLNKSLAQTEERPEQPIKEAELAVGNMVWVHKLKTHAKILSVSDNKKNVSVDYNGMTINLKRKELGQVQPQNLPKEEPKPTTQMTRSYRKPTVSLELNLIGERVEPALQKLDDYIHDAYAAEKQEVRIIHGRGSGQLRTAIHKHLEGIKFVSKFYCPSLDQDQAGDAATYVRF